MFEVMEVRAMEEGCCYVRSVVGGGGQRSRCVFSSCPDDMK